MPDPRSTSVRRLALLLSLSLAALSCAPAGDLEASLAPSFDLPSIGGGRISSDDFDGNVLLLEFWATWCAPCRAQAAILEPLHREYRNRGVSFLAISLGEDQPTVRSFVERHPFPYPVLVDTLDTLTERLGIYALPTVMVVDRNGRVIYSRPGISSGETLRRALEVAMES